ncbi:MULTISPECIES: TadE/TadG family type IV pilus assembly protein [Promicromonospora]|uniref:TadE-like domain-containing protein n=2 Tax=Promicromonospora TaxID=43676 RepID=A0ABP8XH85_9MICO|nr:TadE family protein [Promicromonospora umidemergens]
MTGPGRRDDRGSITLEMIVALPALLGLFFICVQAGLVHHARQVVIAAANQGAFAAAAEYGTGTDGTAAATSFLDQVGDDALTEWSVSATRNATTVQVQITAQAYSILPGFEPEVSAVASAPAETLTRSVTP